MSKHHEVRAGEPLPLRVVQPPRGGEPKPIRESAIDVLMSLEKCSREEAIAILDAPPAPTPPPETKTEREERRAREQHERLRAWLKATKIPVKPEMVERVLLAEHERTDATRAAAAWLLDPSRRVLVLLGPTGIGKTVASALVAVSYAKRHRTVRYQREPALMRMQSSTTLTEQARYTELLEADLLIVDELGMTLSSQGERARNAMFETLDARIGSEGRTILMGNLTKRLPDGREVGCVDALAKAYGARMVDRLHDVGRVVPLGGESMRGRP